MENKKIYIRERNDERFITRRLTEDGGPTVEFYSDDCTHGGYDIVVGWVNPETYQKAQDWAKEVIKRLPEVGGVGALEVKEFTNHHVVVCIRVNNDPILEGSEVTKTFYNTQVDYNNRLKIKSR